MVTALAIKISWDSKTLHNIQRCIQRCSSFRVKDTKRPKMNPPTQSRSLLSYKQKKVHKAALLCEPQQFHLQHYIADFAAQMLAKSKDSSNTRAPINIKI